MPRPDQSTAHLEPDPLAEPAAPSPDHDAIEDVLAAWAESLDRHDVDAGTPDGLPVLPAAAPADAGTSGPLPGQLRRFHAGHPGGGDDLPEPDASFLPALLRPFRDPRRVRHDYPLLLGAGDELGAAPLGAALESLAARLASDPQETRILRDNLPRLEHVVRASLDGAGRGANAAAALSGAARATEEALDLRGESGARFHDDLARLVGLVPPDGTLLPLGPDTPLILFLHVAEQHAGRRRAALEAEVRTLGNRLRDLLRLDDARHAGTDRPDALAGSLGAGAASYVDPEALARVVGSARGAVPMAKEQHDRVRDSLDIFQRFLDGEEGPRVHVVQPEPVPDIAEQPGVAWQTAEPTAVCRVASDLFDETAARFAELFGAMRLARLELEDGYDAARHDGLRASFDWQSFTKAELLSLPIVLAVESVEHLAGPGMLDLSRLLLSGRPVNILVTVQPATNPGFAASDDPLAGYRFELAYLGMSHREAVVNQTTAARPDHLLAGIRRGVAASRAALHVVASGLTADGADPSLGAWLHGGAALEGRAHPVFHYDPEAGETWARRLDFSGNPRPESDWPVYTLPCSRPDGERENVSIAFTFADFALLEPDFRRHYRVIPTDAPEDGLVALDDFLARPVAETGGCVPYIRAIDGANRIRRLAVSRRLAFACRDRLDYWHTLQELAGVRNEYVREALERQQERLEADFDAQRAELRAAHEIELERVRNEAAGDAMRRLAEALLATDIASLAAPAAAAGAAAPAVESAPPAAPAVEAPEPAAAAPPAGADAEPEEPWIESALCTTCNDCMGINPRLFIYNANKQAVIADPQAGTFDELVRAAEKCPARCIHPGTPLRPDEPNLEELVERARPFNV